MENWTAEECAANYGKSIEFFEERAKELPPNCRDFLNMCSTTIWALYLGKDEPYKSTTYMGNQVLRETYLEPKERDQLLWADWAKNATDEEIRKEYNL